jgi:hypothetical protein
MALHRHAALTVPGLWRSARASVSGSGVACLIAAAVALGGCSSLGGGGVASLAVDPGRYDGYHCKDLVVQWDILVDREKELRNLIDKASDGGGGTVVAAVAYRGDYATVLEREKVLKRTAAERNCELEHSYSSDKGIR